MSETVDEAPAVNPADDAPPPPPEPAVAAPVAPPTPSADPAPTFVYALGQIDARFPCLSVEKEMAQASRGPHSRGQTDRQALRAALADPRNRYIARNMCWVLEIEKLETYILVPRDPMDLDLLIEAYRE